MQEIGEFRAIMLTNTQLIALLQLPQMGRKSVIAIAEYAILRKATPGNATELNTFIEECKSKKVARGIKSYLETEISTAIAFAESIEKNSEANGIKITSFCDKDYPAQLKQLTKNGKNESPVILYSKGDYSLLNNMPNVAIIGTRTPTLPGNITTMHVAEEFAKAGFNIVSGLALGCDAAAHRAALGVGGKTTAILAHGLDMVYPPENKSLLNEILEKGGLILSEYPIGTRPQQIFFVERDRLQAGTSVATIVIEASATSGARHAVKVAIANQRQAFCTEYSKNILPPEEGSLFNEAPTLLTEDSLATTITQLKQEF